MKKLSLLLIIMLGVTSLEATENFRMGGIVSVELMEKDYDEIKSRFAEQDNIFPGFYWEVIFRHFGMGNTYQVKFDRNPSLMPGLENEWRLSWIGSFDFRYHLFRHFFVDPFVEASFGCAGGLELTDYEDAGYSEELAEPLKLSLFSQLGVGAALRLDILHVGGRLNYRFYNDVPPVTNFDVFPLKTFQFALFGGFSL